VGDEKMQNKKTVLTGITAINKYLKKYRLNFMNANPRKQLVAIYGFPLIKIGNKNISTEEDIDSWYYSVISNELLPEIYNLVEIREKKIRIPKPKREYEPIELRKYSPRQILMIMKKVQVTYDFKDDKARKYLEKAVKGLAKYRVPEMAIVFSLRNLIIGMALECGKKIQKHNHYERCLKDIKP